MIFIFFYFDKYMLLVLTLMIFVLLFLFLLFFPIMYIVDIVKMGSAYKHLLLLLPFQSDNENVVTCLL